MKHGEFEVNPYDRIEMLMLIIGVWDNISCMHVFIPIIPTR